MNIVAVVVTYNRIELLKRTVRCLQQNKPVSSIVVVNNGSTDATAEWLKTQPGLIVISQANVGGSGGFYTGMQYAYQAGADWIWCMDDDVFPRADCLEQLLLHADREDIGILAPRRLQEGKLFTHEFQGYVPTALMDKEKFFSNDSWSERNKKKKWKRFYQVRNSTYLSHHYGRNWAVRYLRGFNGVAGYILTALLTCPFTDAYQWSDIAKLWKAYCDGIHERLGKM